MIIKLYLSLITIISVSSAQINQWDITLSNNDIIKNSTLNRLVGDSLFVTQNGNEKIVSVLSISKLCLLNESKMFKTGLLWGIVGGLAGGLIVAISDEGENSQQSRSLATFHPGFGERFVIGGAVFGLISLTVGSIVGLLEGVDEVHDLSNVKYVDKVATIQHFLTEQSIEQN